MYNISINLEDLQIFYIMKKIVLLITILFVSVISTACINNLAVQELNNKAKEYMANGEVEKAICRLRSSIDLDTSIFETHYNLGVALIENKEFAEAQTSLKNAIQLNPDYADSYYSLAVACEGEADQIANGTQKSEDKEDIAQPEETNTEKTLTEEQKTKIVDLLNSAIDNYNKYLIKQPESKDKDKIESQINYINSEIKKYNPSRDNSLTDVESTASQTQDED